MNPGTFPYDPLRKARCPLWPGRTLLLALVVCLPLANAATAGDPADLCVLHAQRGERLHHLPPGLLQAIALVETGRQLPGHGDKRPWPWTVQAGGESWHLPTKETALSLIRRIQEEGRTSIDIGCMQINLHFHGDAFSSLEEALDPASNIAYAAIFLQNLMAETGTWRDAAAYYHSRDPTRGARYLGKITRTLRDMGLRRAGVFAAAAEGRELRPP